MFKKLINFLENGYLYSWAAHVRLDTLGIVYLVWLQGHIDMEKK